MYIQERERDEVTLARVPRRRQRQEQGRHVPALQEVIHREEHRQALGCLLRTSSGMMGSSVKLTYLIKFECICD